MRHIIERRQAIHILAALVIMAVAHAPASAQTAPTTVATCPAAAAGTVWAKSAWLPCPGAIAYVAVPVKPNAIVADMRGGTVFSWMLASNVEAADGVWTKTQAVPAGIWSLAKAPNFSVETAAPPAAPYTGTAKLSWTAPGQNVDGSPAALSLIGFNIYSGSASNALTKLTFVGPTTLTWSGSIGVGTTYFAVTAFNPSGESVKSAIVTKSLAAPTAAVPNPPVVSTAN